MKIFADIVSALGLTTTNTVVRGGTQGDIVYEAVLDSGAIKGIRIDVQHKLSGYLDQAGWDPPTTTPPPTDTPGSNTDPAVADGHAIDLSCEQEVMEVGNACNIYVSCQWTLVVKSCGDEGMSLVFGNDSDRVTTWVAQMAYVLVNDFQDYLV